MVTEDTYSELQERMAVGTVIDNRYEVTGYMGRGGFAGVYEALHIHLQRRIAVKVLDLPGSPQAGRQFRDRFLQEARIAARIKHPGVVDIYDFGLLDDTSQPYIAMEFLDGDDLEKHLLREGPMTVLRAVELFAECLEALDEGHDHGIVHKDLKPSNLFVTDGGDRLVILDFGVARVFTDPEAKLTQTGGFSGTPAYLAPEYIEFQTVTPRLDVYQMGLILIETMTGAPAVQASSSMAYMMAHCTGEVNIPDVLEGTELGQVLRKATALKPDERYKDAGEFRDALLAADISAIPRQLKASSSGAGGGESIDVLAETNPFLSSDTGDPVVANRVSRNQVPTAQEQSSSETLLVRSIVVAAIAVVVLGGALAYFLLVEKSGEPAAPESPAAAERIADQVSPSAIETNVPEPVDVEPAITASMDSVQEALTLGEGEQVRSATLGAKEREAERIRLEKEAIQRRKAAEQKRREAEREKRKEARARAEREAAEKAAARKTAREDAQPKDPEPKPEEKAGGSAPSIAY